jgi:formylglycine-generating enzyme required for sulfatase activity
MAFRRILLVLAAAAILAVSVLIGSRLRHHGSPPINMVWIPSGRFLMGSPSDEPGWSSHEVQHLVQISGFWMGKTSVTQEEWTSVMKVNPSSFRGSSRLPVEGVTWYDCIAYCNLRSMKEGLHPCYRFAESGTDPGRWPTGWKQTLHDRITCDWNADGYRLPTEAEWEYACRANTTTATAFGGSLTSQQANFNGEEPYNSPEKGPNLQRTTPVGQYPPNAWGLYDMHGNISQWCWDWYGDYEPGPQSDPRGPTTAKDRRAFRGGSWFNFGADLRSAARFGDKPYFRLDMLPGGIRVARREVE